MELHPNKQYKPVEVFGEDVSAMRTRFREITCSLRSGSHAEERQAEKRSLACESKAWRGGGSKAA